MLTGVYGQFEFYKRPYNNCAKKRSNETKKINGQNCHF